MVEKDESCKRPEADSKRQCSPCLLTYLKWFLIPLFFILLSLILRTYLNYPLTQITKPTVQTAAPTKSGESARIKPPPIKQDEQKKSNIVKKPAKTDDGVVGPPRTGPSPVSSKDMVDFLNSIFRMDLDDFRTIEKETFKLRDILKFNNLHFYPRISSLVQLDPFKFVKFNLKRPCNLFPDIFSCTKIGCSIKFCSQSDLPQSYIELDKIVEEECPTDSVKVLSKVDQTVSEANTRALNELFECSRDDTEDSMYYDLIRNPERYTGYDGSAIWKTIYEENCFARQHENFFTSPDKSCYEERMFYKILSGLHTSITTHLVALDHKFANNFGPNPQEYQKRFYGKHNYMKNLFFIYLIELKALYKIRPYLLDKIRWNLIQQDKVQAQDAIKDLLNTERLFKWHFDDNGLFKQESVASELAGHFHNITYNIIDCVSCDKCRLWGKVQTNGLGTAFKILLTKDVSTLRLSHHEITCLLNAIGRLSNSVAELERFHDIFSGNDKLSEHSNGDGSGNEPNQQILNKFL